MENEVSALFFDVFSRRAQPESDTASNLPNLAKTAPEIGFASGLLPGTCYPNRSSASRLPFLVSKLRVNNIRELSESTFANINFALFLRNYGNFD